MNALKSLFLLLLCTAGVAKADDASQWKLVWSDEFQGNSLDTSKWTCDQGNGLYIASTGQMVWGWGNNELEYYSGRPDNVYVRDGMLHIRAVREEFGHCHYTSAKLITQGHFSKLYGRIEFKAKLPVGKGMWPALWMLPEDNAYGTWPASGEIDIVESRGQEPTKVLGTLHFGSIGRGHDWVEDDFTFPPGQTINEFHVYDLDWEPGVMRYSVDGKLYATKHWWWSSSTPNVGGRHNRPSDSLVNAWPAPYDKPFYIIMNLAIGGNFLGNPDSSTVFPQEMLVKYVRVYDKVGGYSAAEPPIAPHPAEGVSSTGQ